LTVSQSKPLPFEERQAPLSILSYLNKKTRKSKEVNISDFTTVVRHLKTISQHAESSKKRASLIKKRIDFQILKPCNIAILR
jgi:hypothetical protein